MVSDLALILITAGIVTILFKWLKQPVVLGYIIAGFLISPHFLLLPSVADTVNISTLADIGVIFLLFALGLEFSFKKLMAVGGTATIATVINMGSMIAIGYIIGQAMGWTDMESIFLGGMLSMSSTTIIIKAFNDMGLQKQKFAGIVFGMLIVEDLMAIVMMVLLSTVAVSKHFEGMELMDSVLRLIYFMMIWFVVGIFLIPTILKKLKRFLNDETLLIVAVGLCLGMVIFADRVGFSAALGAFIMGSILAETIESKRIEHLIEPLKNLFGAVFFVSVGMMIELHIITSHIWPILMLTVVVLVGRVIFATLGVFATGQGLKVSTRAGFSLAQIGEFSFIIATLGMQLGVLSGFIYPIIVAVSVITTFTTPYFIKASDPLSDFMVRRIPEKWSRLVTGYAANGTRSVNRQNDWRRYLRSTSITVAVYFTLSLAILFIAGRYIRPLVLENLPNVWGALITATVTILLLGPFMNAIMNRGRRSPEGARLWADSGFNRGALISLNLLRVGLCVLLTVLVLIPLFPRMTGWMIIISILLCVAVAFTQGFRDSSKKMEQRFLDNLNDKQRMEENKRPISQKLIDELYSKEIRVEEIDIPQNSSVLGKTLHELHLRQGTGVNVVCIIRGQEKINIPGSDERIYPCDRLVLVGADSNIQAIMSYIESRAKAATEFSDGPSYHIELSQYEIEDGSRCIGKSIKELGIREKTNTLVAAVERGDRVITECDPNFVIKGGDVLLLAGEEKNLDSFEQNLLCRQHGE